MDATQIDQIRKHLNEQYTGIFTDAQIERHILDYVGFLTADANLKAVLSSGKVKSLLDIGCGYGSFILQARKQGIDAIGIDVSQFEIEFARTRIKKEIPSDNPEYVYRLGSGSELPFSCEQFDVVTLWNVMEHSPDIDKLISEVNRVLRTGGRVYIICPNYAAFRTEAHYHIFWPSLLPRKAASVYIRLRGRDPVFFESNIFYRTNWGVLKTLHKYKFDLHNLSESKILNPSLISNPVTSKLIMTIKRFHLLFLVNIYLNLQLLNPLKTSIVLYATKKVK